MPIAALILAAGLLAAVPPLTPEQQGQLQTAADNRSVIDEGALYPLLHNAEQWGPNEEYGAKVPDFDRIGQSPVEARGELFLIEGALAKWDNPPRWFTRGGSWDGRMQRWVVAVGPKEDRYVVVYLVAPSQSVGELRRGHKIRLAGRFYKSWFDVEAGAKAKSYLTFVGRDARIIRPATGETPFPVTMPLAFLLAVTVAGWMVYRYARSRTGVYEHGEQIQVYSRTRPEDARDPRDAPEEDEGPPLPKDPTAALIELSRRAAEERLAREADGSGAASGHGADATSTDADSSNNPADPSHGSRP
ncbi:MAG: hypothetical protein NTW19_11435 [Planctomycetota bacterium]|nr:hypothetical protein [Planctomycetota bacterium]